MSELRDDIKKAVAEILSWPLSRSEQEQAIADEVMALLGDSDAEDTEP